MKRSIFFSVLFLVATSNFIAQKKMIPGQSEFEMAEDLFQSKKYTSWITLLDMAIVQNHPKAIIRKGDAYSLGLGVEQNYSEALTWYKKAAELNNSDAINSICKMYLDTLIEGEAYADAVNYFQLINKNGVSATNAIIGDAYLYGLGVEKNSKTAFEWYSKGVDILDPVSIYGLGMFYLTDENSDIEKSLGNLEQACDLNYLVACETLGELYYKGDHLEADVEPSIKWFAKGIALNGAKSYYYFASYMLLGYIEGGKPDALAYAKKAKDLGYDKLACEWLILKINGEMK